MNFRSTDTKPVKGVKTVSPNPVPLESVKKEKDEKGRKKIFAIRFVNFLSVPVSKNETIQLNAINWSGREKDGNFPAAIELRHYTTDPNGAVGTVYEPVMDAGVFTKTLRETTESFSGKGLVLTASEAVALIEKIVERKDSLIDLFDAMTVEENMSDGEEE